MYPSNGSPQLAALAQYATSVPPLPMAFNGKWSTGLCNCGDDVSNCCITCWCPCITFGQIAEIIDKGNTSCVIHGILYTVLSQVTQCQWIYTFMYRSKMRQQYNLLAEPCSDCCLHCCCEKCALCQEYRELKHRGFDMDLGWDGNMARHNQGIQMPPFDLAEMKR